MQEKDRSMEFFIVPFQRTKTVKQKHYLAHLLNNKIFCLIVISIVRTHYRT